MDLLISEQHFGIFLSNSICMMAKHTSKWKEDFLNLEILNKFWQFIKQCNMLCCASSEILMPQVFNIPKVEHDQPCSTLVVLFFKISLFIYVILGADWSIAKNNINKQTNFEKQNNQSWAWLITLNFGNAKNLGHYSQIWLIVSIGKEMIGLISVWGFFSPTLAEL